MNLFIQGEMVKVLWSRLWHNRDSWFVLSVLVVSLSLNVYSFRRLRQLPRRAGPPGEEYIVGSRLPELEAKDLAGNGVVLNWLSNKPATFIYVFSPTCPWCKRNLPNVKAIAEARKDSFRFIGLSLGSEGAKTFVESNGLTFPVYVDPRERGGRKFGVQTVPTTLVILPDGKIQEYWLGAYGGSIQQDIEAKLRVHLQALQPMAGSR